MVEGSFRSVDPLAYYVNNIAEFDKELVTAFKHNKSTELANLVARGRSDYDVFICVSPKDWHGFVICVPAKTDPQFEEVINDVIKSPFDVPDLLMCYVFELCFDNTEMRTYKIHKKFSLFKDVKQRIGERSYFIGHYKDISVSGFQVAAMRAAPHRYAAILHDCVEFAKEFCVQALAFCSNYQDIKNDVHENIKKAIATGFSVEHLSRKIKSSGWIGNVSLGGTDISSLLSQRNANLT